MNRKQWMFASGVAVVGVLAGAGSVAATIVDDDAPLTGETRDKAVAAAVAHIGGGAVTETELGDDGAAYGVELRKPDGTQVEVNLDQNYGVTSTEADDDGPDDDGPDGDGPNDDDGPNDPDDDPGEPTSDPNAPARVQR